MIPQSFLDPSRNFITLPHYRIYCKRFRNS
jgi:fatty acid amide hydrolase 2